MALELVTVPCLSDNYAFLLHCPDSGATVVVDVPEAAPVLEVLEERGWSASDVWITHHHDDHVQGLGALLEKHDAKVTGAAADRHRLPRLDVAVKGGDRFEFCGHPVHVIDASGHTVGHIAYHATGANAVFTGDSLMALGCGRLFEGTPDRMWGTLCRLKTLPADTLVCSGHEYTAANAKFALTIDPENEALISRSEKIAEARRQGNSTVPSTLALELQTNPFLRADDPDIRALLGMKDAGDVDVFAEIRARKDAF